MYVLMNDQEEMFAGYECGCVTTKRHWTRSYVYQTLKGAEKDITHYGLVGFTVEELEE